MRKQKIHNTQCILLLLPLIPLTMALANGIQTATTPKAETRRAEYGLEGKKQEGLLKNIARGKPVSSSDNSPIFGELKMITDGDKSYSEGSSVGIGPGIQHIQIDLGAPHDLYTLLFWQEESRHEFFSKCTVYHDLIVRTADDPAFTRNVHTLFNNDRDNSSGLGHGKDMEYMEDFRGKSIDMQGVRSRYVRIMSNGSTKNEWNQFIEVEIYGLKDSNGKVPLKLDLPQPRPLAREAWFVAKSKNLPKNAKPWRVPLRLPFLVPEGVKNIAYKKPVTSSDKSPIIGRLEQVTDGDKSAVDGSFVELAPGSQYVQIDLGSSHNLYAVLFWQEVLVGGHSGRRVYFDVVVRTANDPEFTKNVQTHFNNDHDNSSGLGRGEDKEYFENYQGKLVDLKGVGARYVRLYSNGNTSNELNHYVEVEVYGLPMK